MEAVITMKNSEEYLVDFDSFDALYEMLDDAIDNKRPFWRIGKIFFNLSEISTIQAYD